MCGGGGAPSLEYSGPPSTEAVAAEQGGAALSPEAKAGPPYCGEPGGSLAAVALGLSLRRSLASPAVHTVNLHGAIAFTLPSPLPPPFCFSAAFPSPITPQFPSSHPLVNLGVLA